jgi:hypothetical protein
MASKTTRGTIRFLHTADWHIGKQFASLGAPLEKLAYLRQARIESIRRIASIAKSRNASVVLVAGDVFDHNDCGDRVVRETIHALEGSQIDWVLLSGNHDPGGPASVWARFKRIGCPSNVHLASAGEALVLCDGSLGILAAPLNRKRYSADPTEHFASISTPPSAIRVGLAHGCIGGKLNPSAELYNMIASERSDEARLDYLALGDWHSTAEVAPRTWYAGTPEPDDFDQRDSGNVLLVEIDGAGQLPRVEPISTATYRWQRLDGLASSPAAPDQLRAALSQLTNISDLVLDLTVTGTVSLSESLSVREVLADLEVRVHVLRLATEGLIPIANEDDLNNLRGNAFFSSIIDRLGALRNDPADPDRIYADVALQRMYLETINGGRQ